MKKSKKIGRAHGKIVTPDDSPKFAIGFMLQANKPIYLRGLLQVLEDNIDSFICIEVDEPAKEVKYVLNSLQEEIWSKAQRKEMGIDW